uniref:Uncharacterized protein n=1 Tax=Alexandrium monilatum TaxID=311494 RepID=A0A7S4WAH5_9DINO
MPSGDDHGASAVIPCASLATSSDDMQQVPPSSRSCWQQHVEQLLQDRGTSRVSPEERDMPAAAVMSEVDERVRRRRPATLAALGQFSTVVPDRPVASSSSKGTLRAWRPSATPTPLGEALPGAGEEAGQRRSGGARQRMVELWVGVRGPVPSSSPKT